MKIGIVTEYYYPHLGGICEHVHFLAREARLPLFPERGDAFDVVGFDGHAYAPSNQPGE